MLVSWQPPTNSTEWYDWLEETANLLNLYVNDPTGTDAERTTMAQTLLAKIRVNWPDMLDTDVKR